MRDKSPLDEHERRVEILRTLANLTGYSVPLRHLPGGFIPDVIQCSLNSAGLFVGDAKNTETPFNRRTQVRLLHYLHTLAVLLRRPDSHGVFAVCFGNRAIDWEQVISMLMLEAGVQRFTIKKDSFGSHRLVWCLCWYRREMLPATSVCSRGSYTVSCELG